jgi:hypothetical protein
MERRYQVFVSSTYTDLIDERREVIQALLELECLPAAMEIFPAATEDQWTLIKQVIDESDYYIVIVGGRYGSTTAEGISYTEQEYDYAVESGVPVLGFVHANPDNIPLGRSEIDSQAREALARFREKVMSRMVKTYASPSDLGSVVSRALVRAMKTTAREGWVRGRFAMSPELQAEVAELRSQVVELRREAERSQDSVPSDLAAGDDTYRIYARMTYIRNTDMSLPSYERDDKKITVSADASWNEIFGAVGHSLMDEAPEPSLKEPLNQLSLSIWAEYSRAEDAPDFGKLISFQIHPDSLSDIVIQLFALGLIQRGVKKRPIADSNKYWALTTRGEDTLLKLRAIRRKDLQAS